MKKIVVLMAFFLSACGAQVPALAPSPDTEYPTSQATTTQPVPTTIVEYQATVHVAETQVAIANATADEAIRVVVQATNDESQRQHEKYVIDAQGTQQINDADFMRDSWTATAALTAVPLTSTAQVDNLTAISSYSTLTTSLITATAALPTQIVAVANANAQAKFAPLYSGVQIFALFGLGAFLIFTVFFMRWYWVREDARAHARSPQGVAEQNGFKPIPRAAPELDPQIIYPTETVLTIKQDHGGGMGQFNRLVVPCTKGQLNELAEKIVSENRSLAINQWEGADTLFTRESFGKIRAWMQSNRFAASTGGGALALTSDGRAFLDAWLNTQNLPTDYEFEEVTA